MTVVVELAAGPWVDADAGASGNATLRAPLVPIPEAKTEPLPKAVNGTSGGVVATLKKYSPVPPF